MPSVQIAPHAFGVGVGAGGGGGGSVGLSVFFVFVVGTIVMITGDGVVGEQVNAGEDAKVGMRDNVGGDVKVIVTIGVRLGVEVADAAKTTLRGLVGVTFPPVTGTIIGLRLLWADNDLFRKSCGDRSRFREQELH